MPGWGDILTEVGTTPPGPNGESALDVVRRKYLARVHELTGRSVVLYAADFSSPLSQIQLSDMQGLMEAFRGLPGDDLDIILHSPGGQAEATDRLVRYIRAKFSGHIRVFVPLAAMSAATMLAMSADEIVMGKHSQLGPIDPQVQLPNWQAAMPAGALIDQFNKAAAQCAENPALLTAWLPTLQQYPPGLLNVCENASALAQELVREWLTSYMLKDDPEQANVVAKWLADDKQHLSHSRAITRDQLTARNLAVANLEENQDLQDAVLSVHHVTMSTLDSTGVFKIIESHPGHTFIQQQAPQVQMQMPFPFPGGPAPAQG